jgi:hypothetical protein
MKTLCKNVDRTSYCLTPKTCPGVVLSLLLIEVNMMVVLICRNIRHEVHIRRNQKNRRSGREIQKSRVCDNPFRMPVVLTARRVYCLALF